MRIHSRIDIDEIQLFRAEHFLRAGIATQRI
jgi:hypothetical protein